jgi:hypothetical protein
MRAAMLALVATACATSPRSPAPPEHRDNTADAAPPAVDRKLLADVAAGLEEVLAAMAQITAGDDCPAMGAQLRELFDRSRPLFDLARTQGDNPDAAAVLTEEMNARAARVRPLVDAIGPGLERCRAEPSVVDAIRQMPTF